MKRETHPTKPTNSDEHSTAVLLSERESQKFEAWLTTELADLEQKFADFASPSSTRNFFNRS